MTLPGIIGMVATAIAFMNPPSRAHGQRVVVIKDVERPPFKIELTEVAVLPDSVYRPGDHFSITVDRRGRFYIAAGGPGGVYRGKVFVFDSAGRYLTSFGRAGKGPGEYGDAPLVADRTGDTIVAFDGSQVTVLTPNYNYVRRQNFAFAIRSSPVTLSNGNAIIEQGGRGWLPSPSSSTYPGRIIVFDGNWKEIRRFQTTTDATLGPNYTSASGTGIWRQFSHSYELEQWDANGNRTTVLRRDVKWFPPRAAYEKGGPLLHYISEDPAGNLWIQILVPAGASDTTAVVAGRKVSGSATTFDTIIEVIDPGRGALLASKRLTGSRWFFLGPSRIFQHLEGEGETGYTVFRRKLVPYPQKTELR
jgi:hypothetical protein